ncbi:MAG TPA: methyltransferase domain-containing protein [Candidatus Acidoferrales bacterium]|nr:methyltransferase domain-containing protein [Candidatus Acidoferrales bacterium]
MNGKAAEFHCWHAATRDEALRKGEYLGTLYTPFLRAAPIVDLGCGEGALLLWLKEHGHGRVLGVESNVELCGLAESFGVPVTRSDLLEYLRANGREPAVYFYLDVIEHVPFEVNEEVFRRLPVGSRVIVQTPNTNSVLGHQFYMQVPSHVAPYSPHVLHGLLNRLGYSVVAEGGIGNRPPTWTNRFRGMVLRRLLGLDPELLWGGGNYFVVADRVRNE